MSFARLVELLARVWLGLGAVYVLAFVAVTVWLLNRTGADSREIDLAALWAGARMALSGEAVAAFDPDALRGAMGRMLDFGGGVLHWRYPANLHALIAPLGLLPFSLALALVVAGSWAALWAAFRGWAGALPGGLAPVLAAPVVLFTLTSGQIALFFVAALAGGLWALGQGRRALAGALFGLLCLKPSLVPVVLLALIAGRAWTVILWAGMSGLAGAALGAAAFGLAHWHAFFAALDGVQAEAAAGLIAVDRMVSPFAFLSAQGWRIESALATHTAVAVAAALAVAWLWAVRAPPSARGAALALAVPLATPYAHYYEMGYALIAIALLAGPWAGSWWRCALLALLWIAPLPGLVAWQSVPLAFYAPVLLVAVLACIVADAAVGRRRDVRG